MLNQALISQTIDALLEGGADFAEVFVERRRNQGFEWNQSLIKSVTAGITYGAGLRLIYGDEVLYVHSNDLEASSLLKFAREAAAIKVSPKAGGAVQKAAALQQQNLPQNNTYDEAQAFWQVPHQVRIDRCKLIDEAASKHRDSVTNRIVRFSESKQEIQIANSEGLFVEDSRFYSKYGITVFAEANGKKEVATQGNGYATTSDYFDSIDFTKIAQERADLADRMTKADYAPTGEMPVIIAAGQGTLIHEACGHSLETTSVAEGDSVFSGKLGEKVAHNCVSLVDDGTIKNHWGSINTDDEGTEVQKTTLIKDGKLVSYLTDRIGAAKIDHVRTGSARRESYKFAPTSRMRSTYIDKGESKLEDMLQAMGKGLFVQAIGGGSVSPATGEYQFGAVESYKVEGGKIGDLVKGATLIGRGEQTLKDITMVSDNLDIKGGGMCGSRSGWVPVDVGQPDVLISKLLIGGRS